MEKKKASGTSVLVYTVFMTKLVWGISLVCNLTTMDHQTNNLTVKKSVIIKLIILWHRLTLCLKQDRDTAIPQQLIM